MKISLDLMYCELQGCEINLIIKVSIKLICFLIQKYSLLNLVRIRPTLLISCVHISDNVWSFRKENTWTLGLFLWFPLKWSTKCL